MSGTVSPDPCSLLKTLEATYLQAIQGNSIASIIDENGEQVQYSKGDIPSILEAMTRLQEQCTAYRSPFLQTGRQTAKPLRFGF